MAEQGELFEVKWPLRVECWVYVIGMPGKSIAKIGKAIDVRKRLASLQTSNPQELHVLWRTPGSRALERELHARFDSYRLGGEWFDFGDLDPAECVRQEVERITGYVPLDGDGAATQPHPTDPDFDDPRYQSDEYGCRELTPLEQFLRTGRVVAGGRAYICRCHFARCPKAGD